MFFKTMTDKAKIKFLADSEDNARFNADFERAAKAFGKEHKETLKFLVLDYLKLTPMRNYSMAFSVLDIASMEIQRSLMLIDLQKKDGTSRNDAEAVNRFTNGIKLAKEQIGIDPKSLASKGDGSMSEAFADVVSQCRFDTRRFVCKPIFGFNKQRESVNEASADEFAKMSDAKIEAYLETAATK